MFNQKYIITIDGATKHYGHVREIEQELAKIDLPARIVHPIGGRTMEIDSYNLLLEFMAQDWNVVTDPKRIAELKAEQDKLIEDKRARQIEKLAELTEAQRQADMARADRWMKADMAAAASAKAKPAPIKVAATADADPKPFAKGE